MQYIGRQSYALYLWHWPVIVLALIVWPDMSITGSIGCLAGTFLLAALSYRFIESPVRTSPWLSARKHSAIAFAVVLTITGAMAATSAGLLGRHLSQRPEQMAFTRAQTQQSKLAQMNCLATLTETNPKECRFGDPHATARFVLFGDSHAAQWFTPLRSIAGDNHAELIAVLKSSCAVSDVQVLSFRLRRLFTECDEWRRAAVRKVIALKPDVIILSQHSVSYVRQEGVDRGAARVSPLEWAQGLQKTLSAFEQARIPTVVIADTPEMGFNVPTCLGRAARWAGQAADCMRQREYALNALVSEGERRAVAAISNTRYIDVNDLLCPDTVCFPTRDSKVLYRDANHVTEDTAAGALQTLKLRMQPVLSGWLPNAGGPYP